MQTEMVSNDTRVTDFNKQHDKTNLFSFVLCNKLIACKNYVTFPGSINLINDNIIHEVDS